MKKSLAILVLAASSAFAQMAGTNYVTVMFDRANGKFYPQPATDFTTNNTSIQNLQNALAHEIQTRAEADLAESNARMNADLLLSIRVGDLESDMVTEKKNMAGVANILLGGPLFPNFIRARGVTINSRAQQYVRASDEVDLGNIFAIQYRSGSMPFVDTSKIWWDTARGDNGLEPKFEDTDTMTWSVGNPEGIYGAGTGTGFWWKVPGPCVGSWKFSYGSYTNETFVENTYTNGFTWIWSRNKPESLVEKINNDMYAMASRPDRDICLWAKFDDKVAYSHLYTSDAIRNPNFWAAEMDLTCVSPLPFPVNQPGYGNYANHTAITRRHVLAANHWHLAAGSAGTIHFYDNDSNIHVRRIVRGAKIGDADLWLGMLDEDLPESILPAKIINPDDWDKLLPVFPEGQQGFVYDGPGIQHRNDLLCGKLECVNLRSFASRSMWCDIDKMSISTSFATYTNAATPYSTASWWHGEHDAFIGGDSSSPILTWIDGQTVLLSITTSNGGNCGAGQNVSYLSSLIDEQIKAWAEQYGGTAETNLYWCDLSDWPHFSPVEPENGED